MKLYLLAATLALTNLQATNLSTDFHWGEDSTSAFSLTVVGKGLSWHDTFVSPSGLWGFDFTLTGEYEPRFPDYPIRVNDWGQVSFLGQSLDNPVLAHPVLLIPGYNDQFPADAPIFDSNHLSPEYLPREWTGQTPYVITSMPDVTDNSTWEWVLNIYAHGPALHVPESGGILCLALGAIILLFWHRKALA